MSRLEDALRRLDHAFYTVLDRMEENMPEASYPDEDLEALVAETEEDIENAVSDFKKYMEEVRKAIEPGREIEDHFPDYEEIQPGNWSRNGRIIQYGPGDKDAIEIGLYREPDDGSYTIHVFDRDDVIACHTVEGLGQKIEGPEYICSNIDWDIDDDDIDLPETVIVSKAELVGKGYVSPSDDQADVQEKIVDYLSDRYGYCIRGLSISEGKPTDFGAIGDDPISSFAVINEAPIPKSELPAYKEPAQTKSEQRRI